MLICRYKGFSRLLNAFRQLGLLGAEPMQRSLQGAPQLLLDNLSVARTGMAGEDNMKSVIRERLGDQALVDETVDALKWYVILLGPFAT